MAGWEAIWAATVSPYDMHQRAYGVVGVGWAHTLDTVSYEVAAQLVAHSDDKGYHKQDAQGTAPSKPVYDAGQYGGIQEAPYELAREIPHESV